MVENPTKSRGLSVPSGAPFARDGRATTRGFGTAAPDRARSRLRASIGDGIEALEAVGQSRPTRRSADDDGDKVMTAMLLGLANG